MKNYTHKLFAKLNRDFDEIEKYEGMILKYNVSEVIECAYFLTISKLLSGGN